MFPDRRKKDTFIFMWQRCVCDNHSAIQLDQQFKTLLMIDWTSLEKTSKQIYLEPAGVTSFEWDELSHHEMRRFSQETQFYLLS